MNGRAEWTLLLLVIVARPVASRAAEALPSWNDGEAKPSILRFVESVTREGAPTFVPQAERIAVFDNDGTLWAEQPLYFQLVFAVDQVKALAPKHPEWKSQEPFASLLKGDVAGARAGGERARVQVLSVSPAGPAPGECAQD